jgi:hypothetical protein
MKVTTIGAAVGVISGLAFYLTLAWRTFIHNRGNKLVASGCLTLGCFALAAYSSYVPNFPFWLAGCFITLAMLFALTTLSLAIQRVWLAIRRPGTSAKVNPPSEAGWR